MSLSLFSPGEDLFNLLCTTSHFPSGSFSSVRIEFCTVSLNGIFLLLFKFSLVQVHTESFMLECFTEASFLLQNQGSCVYSVAVAEDSE